MDFSNGGTKIHQFAHTNIAVFLVHRLNEFIHVHMYNLCADICVMAINPSIFLYLHVHLNGFVYKFPILNYYLPQTMFYVVLSSTAKSMNNKKKTSLNG